MTAPLEHPEFSLEVSPCAPPGTATRLSLRAVIVVEQQPIKKPAGRLRSKSARFKIQELD